MPITRARSDFTDSITWSFSGTLALTTTQQEIPWNPEKQIELISARGSIRAVSAGATVIFEIRRFNASMVDQGSIFPTTADRPTIPIGSFTNRYLFVAPLPRWTVSDFFVGKVVQIGSAGTEGAGGSLTLRFREILS